jgi:nucleoside-diphosphate-sugar epimerase
MRVMRILVTGSRGLVGTYVASTLRASNHDVVEYDLQDSHDVLDLPQLLDATRGCDAIIHAAALLGRPGETTDQIMMVNVQGTWNVIAASAKTATGRIVFLSSVDAFGVFKGERPPDYLPLDIAHPCYPTTPYGISKYLAEEACRLSSDDQARSVVSLRPPGVWTPDTYAEIESKRRRRPSYEWDPYWEYGVFIDVRDLSRACLSALTCEAGGYCCLLVSSSDITTSGRTSRDMVQSIHPGLEWRGGIEYDVDPYRTLLDIEPAHRILGWRPEYTWERFSQKPR